MSRLRTSPHSNSVADCIAEMFYDLNVPWSDDLRELQRTVAFLDECKWELRTRALACLARVKERKRD
jgi:hypothetical protein